MKKIRFALLALGLIVGLFCFISCGDDDSRGGRYVGYNDHDDDWGKCTSINSDNFDDTYSYDVSQK